MVRTIIIAAVTMMAIGCNEIKSVSNYDQLTAREQEWYNNQSVSVQNKINVLDSASFSDLRYSLSVRLDLSDEMSALCDEMNTKFGSDSVKFEMNYR